MNCLRALPDLLVREDVVLVTVAQTRGSTPREAGTSMLVSMTQTVDTIGGGHLEWEAMAHARAMLLQATAAPSLQRLSLGASLGQCCGGGVWLVFEQISRSDRDAWIARMGVIDSGKSLTRALLSNSSSQWTVCSRDEAEQYPGPCLQTHHSPPGSSSHPVTNREGNAAVNDTPAIEATSEATSARARRATAAEWTFTERVTPCSLNITLFGAGHVGAAIVHILSTLDANIRWVDVRDDLFGTTPANVTCIATDAPEEEVDHAAPDTFFLVLTHSHALDLELTAHILRRDDFAWFGLIGSRTKRARFEHRLHAQGISHAQLERMTCPIGIAGISDKAPQAIAIAVVAQLLQAKERHDSHCRKRELTHDD